MDKQYLHITSLDGTITPSAEDLKIGIDPKPYAHLYSDFLKRHPDLKFVYCTSRTVPTLLDLLRDYELPCPSYVIASGGGQIYDTEKEELVSAWQKIVQTVAFDAAKIKEILTGFIPRMALLGDREQSDVKIAYHIEDAGEGELYMIKKALSFHRYQINIIYIRSEGSLFILPTGIDKGTSITFLSSFLDFPMSNIVVSGYQENDKEMFDLPVGCRIVPENVDPYLKQYIEEKGIDAYLGKGLYSSGVIPELEHFITNGV